MSPSLETDSTAKKVSENELSTIRTELKKLRNELLQNESAEFNPENLGPIQEFESLKEEPVPTNQKTNKPVSPIHEQVRNLLGWYNFER